MNRRDAVIALLGLGAAPLTSVAQQQGKVWRVGFLSSESRLDPGRYAAFLRGMRDLGYFEGKNLAMDARFAEGQAENLSRFAMDLVQSKVDVIVTADRMQPGQQSRRLRASPL